MTTNLYFIYNIALYNTFKNIHLYLLDVKFKVGIYNLQ